MSYRYCYSPFQVVYSARQYPQQNTTHYAVPAEHSRIPAAPVASMETKEEEYLLHSSASATEAPVLPYSPPRAYRSPNQMEPFQLWNPYVQHHPHNMQLQHSGNGYGITFAPWTQHNGYQVLPKDADLFSTRYDATGGQQYLDWKDPTVANSTM